MAKISSKLKMWQERLGEAELAYSREIERMERREELYRGSRRMEPILQGNNDRGGMPSEAAHVRNIVAELIEAEVDSTIPMPKVTPLHAEDEHLARVIEDMLRNELDRLPFEMLNDMAERTVPIQGGGYYLVDWDNRKRTHTTIGELAVSFLHPKMVIPQDGVWTSVEDMDYIFIQCAETKEYIKMRYGKDVSAEAESDPEIRGVEAEGVSVADDLVTLNIAYWRNNKGGIGRYAWVNNIELEDLDDYQARRTRKCENCGRHQPIYEEATEAPDYAAMEMGGLINFSAVAAATPPGENKDICPICGGKYVDSADDYEEIWEPLGRNDGSVISLPPVELIDSGMVDDLGQPVMMSYQPPLTVPFYKPDKYPLILQRNISLFGRLLGDSDVDKIADQQNTINALEGKINDKLMTGGSYVILPKDTNIKTTNEEIKCIYPKNQADANMIRVVTAQANTEADMYHMAEVYEEARQVLGITDSYQGRKDTTATSGKAKEFAANMSAGRLQSKRIMKNAAYAQLFELMFKFKLAYADEERPVVSKDEQNKTKYEVFDRYDFLKQDAAGEWYWNDQFLFSVDDAGSLATNREGMWQETMSMFSAGAFGDPTNIDTLIMLWTTLEKLHYPTAGDKKDYLLGVKEAMANSQQLAQQLQMRLAQQQAAQDVGFGTANGGQGPAVPGDAAAQQIVESTRGVI